MREAMALVRAVPAPVLRLSSGAQTWLWWFAIGMMLVDHGFMVLAPGTVATEVVRAVTRLGWPIFGLLPAYNIVVRGVKPSRYYRPMLVLMVASQVPFMLLFGWKISIFGTLLMGIGLLAVWRGELSRWWLGLVPLAFVVDYGLPGVLLPLVFAWYLDSPRWSVLTVVAGLVLLNNWSQPEYAAIALLVPVLLPVARVLPHIERLPKWARYMIYPVHLSIFALILYWPRSG